MTAKAFGNTILIAALLAAGSAQAQEVVRLGNLKFAHYGAVSYIKEIAPKCGIKVEEKVFAKGLDVMQAIIAGEIDVGTTASEAAISGRAGNAPIYVVAGFAKGGARLVAGQGSNIKSVKDLKGKDVQLIFLAYADLNQALLGKNIDAMMQSEPQSSQAINKGFGTEIVKPYDTPIGEPVRTMVMTEKFYTTKRPLAEKFMRCFVQATSTFIKDPVLAEKYVREVVFKGQITSDDFRDAMDNAEYTYDITPEHIQVTTDIMYKTGVGRMAKPPAAKEWVKTDLLEAAKKSLNVK
jgi:NitT/TauT family transport system substrate-binding protein